MHGLENRTYHVIREKHIFLRLTLVSQLRMYASSDKEVNPSLS